jgi:hypothetical protein
MVTKKNTVHEKVSNAIHVPMHTHAWIAVRDGVNNFAVT